MANDAARHISPEGSPRWRWSSASSRRRDLGTEAIDRRAGDAVASGKSDSAEGPIRATAMDDAQSSASAPSSRPRSVRNGCVRRASTRVRTSERDHSAVEVGHSTQDSSGILRSLMGPYRAPLLTKAPVTGPFAGRSYPESRFASSGVNCEKGKRHPFRSPAASTKGSSSNSGIPLAIRAHAGVSGRRGRSAGLRPPAAAECARAALTQDLACGIEAGRAHHAAAGVGGGAT